MDYLSYNRNAWNSQVRKGNRWTIPVDSDTIRKARHGDWSIVLTPRRHVPQDWLGEIKGRHVLCLAGGGGQQAPILAAAGAMVTTFDNSDSQLEQDRIVAHREALHIDTIQGDMADLSEIADTSFDRIIHPCSNCFVPELQPVWNEAFRVLKPGGRLLSGWSNPVRYIFDAKSLEAGELVVRHRIPYSDLNSLTPSELQELIEDNEPFVFGHSLDEQLGGQIRAGFHIIGFYEDDWADENDTLSEFISDFAATCAEKPANL